MRLLIAQVSLRGCVRCLAATVNCINKFARNGFSSMHIILINLKFKEPKFWIYISILKGLAQLIATHLQSGSSCSKNLCMKCISCSNESCAEMRRYFRTSQEILDIAKKESSMIGWYFEDHLRLAFLLALSINLRMIIHFFKDGLTIEFCKMGTLVPETTTSNTKGKWLLILLFPNDVIFPKIRLSISNTNSIQCQSTYLQNYL